MAVYAPHLSTMARAMSVIPLANLQAFSVLPVVESFARFDSFNVGAPRCISRPSTAGLPSTISPVSTLILGITGSLFAVSCGLQDVHLLGFISSPALLRAVVKLTALAEFANLSLPPPHCEVISVGQIRCLRTAIPNARANRIPDSGNPCGTPLRVACWCGPLGALVYRTDPVSCHGDAK